MEPPASPTSRLSLVELGPKAQRTVSAILESFRVNLVEKGYGATSIDDITSLAGVSRATFYTYFPTKGDALLAIGRDATIAARAAIVALDLLPDPWSESDLAQWLDQNLGFLDTFGNLGLTWSQATAEDPELRHASMATHLETCRLLGVKLNSLRPSPLADDTQFGLLVLSMLERTWIQQRLYEPTVATRDVIDAAAQILAQLLSGQFPKRV